MRQTPRTFIGLLFNSPLKNREGNWSELAFAKTFGIVTGNTPLSYWPFFSLVLKNIPRRLCKSSLGQFSFSFLEWRVAIQTHIKTFHVCDSTSDWIKLFACFTNMRTILNGYKRKGINKQTVWYFISKYSILWAIILVAQDRQFVTILYSSRVEKEIFKLQSRQWSLTSETTLLLISPQNKSLTNTFWKKKWYFLIFE